MIKADIFKANDIRGVVGSEWNARGAYWLGAAYAELIGDTSAEIVIGRDMRASGEELSRSFAAGVRSRGVSVADTGLASTDQLWYASGSLNLPGVQFTASHNPASYNGIKFCRPGAAPVDAAFLADLAERALAFVGEDEPGTEQPLTGNYRTIDTLADYAAYLQSLVDLTQLRRLRVVVDAGNGMAGHTVGACLAGLDLELIGLYLELDGTFPHHQPNPLEPENLVDAQAAVRTHGADLALVFDGDADRCFIIDERGEVISPSVVTALIAASALAGEPGGVIVVNSVTSGTVAQVVAELGGTVVVSKVGHTHVKALMAAHDAAFGGEHSAHYYFRDFWGADTGMLAALHVLSLLGRQDRPLSELVAEYQRVAHSGELNSTVADVAAALARVEAAFAGRGVVDHGDGLTVRGLDEQQRDWWLNVRPSNTEPLLRLNVEAGTDELMAALRDEVLDLVRQPSPTRPSTPPLTRQPSPAAGAAS